MCTRAGPVYKLAKVQPRPLRELDFLAKKLEIPLAPMVNRKTPERKVFPGPAQPLVVRAG